MNNLRMPNFEYGTSIFDSMNRGLEQGRQDYDRETIAEMGKKALSGDWQGAQNTAFSRGNWDAGMKVQSFRDGQADRSEAKAARGREMEAKIARDAAGIFQNYIDVEQDPAKKTAMTQQFIKAHPEMGPRLQRYGVNVNDPGAVSQFFQAQARGYVDPAEAEKQKLEVEYKRALIDKARRPDTPDAVAHDKTPEGRAALAVSLGLKPGTDIYNSYVMTGKLPREDQQRLTVTDKKAILEADEAVAATQGAIESLRRAMTLSKTAYDGAMAGERGWITSQFGSNAGNDTRELNQVVTEGALQQLKAIFGGMPTEGERKILLEIQGSAEMPQDVRERIYQRALQLAEKRLQFNQARANELRSGTFYQSDTAAQPTPPVAPAAPTAPEQASFATPDEIPEGAKVRDEQTGQTLQKVNGKMVPVN